MVSKITKSLIYFIFSAVFVSTTAFFINENYSLRIYINTLTFTTLNYFWVVVLFTQFIYIYRSGIISVGNIYLITTISIILILLVNTLFEPFDYTSLVRNNISEMFISRTNINSFSISHNSYFIETVSRVKTFDPKLIYFLLNPAILYWANNRTENSSTIIAIVFILEILFFLYFGNLLYTEFYIILIILLLKFGGKNESV